MTEEPTVTIAELRRLAADSRRESKNHAPLVERMLLPSMNAAIDGFIDTVEVTIWNLSGQRSQLRDLITLANLRRADQDGDR